MADTANVRSGDRINAVEHLVPGVVDTTRSRSVILSLLMLMAVGAEKNGIAGIGLPDSKDVFAGKMIPKSDTMVLDEIETYMPEIEIFSQPNVALLGTKDTIPQIYSGGGSGATFTVTRSSDRITAVTITAGGTLFNGNVELSFTGGGGKGAWAYAIPNSSGVLASVVIVSGGEGYTSDPTVAVASPGVTSGETSKRVAYKWATLWAGDKLYKDHQARSEVIARYALMGSKNPLAAAAGDAKARVYEKIMRNLTIPLTNQALYGRPTSQTATYWDRLSGIYEAIDTANTYAGIDRGVAANAAWKGTRVAWTGGIDFRKLFRDFKNSRGGADYGLTGVVVIVGSTLFSQAEAQADGSVTPVHILGGAVPGVKKVGWHSPLVVVDGLPVVRDSSIPDGHVIILNMDTWFMAFKKDMKFYSPEPEDMSTRPGGEIAWFYQVWLRVMMGTVAPRLNAIYTGVA